MKDSKMSTRNGIKNHFEQYLTTDYGSECIDVTSEQERLPPDYQNHLDTIQEWARELDSDMEGDNPPF